uniref:Uncharacterized protein n=1 Tax=Trypanosoma congolense (strain IL3000) TaxID=1068625 RepID=G0USA7_TRYCI|nr:hypothetical protein, unlikely [Trypanosoma congolense IL3000]
MLSALRRVADLCRAGATHPLTRPSPLKRGIFLFPHESLLPLPSPFTPFLSFLPFISSLVLRNPAPTRVPSSAARYSAFSQRRRDNDNRRRKKEKKERKESSEKLEIKEMEKRKENRFVTTCAPPPFLPHLAAIITLNVR